MRGRSDLLFSVVILVVFGAALLLAVGWPLGAKLFPIMVATVGMSLAFMQIISDLSKSRQGLLRPTSAKVPRRRELVAFGWLLGFAGAIALLGFQWGLSGVFFLYYKLESREKLVVSILLTAICWGVIYVSRSFLYLPLYDGLLFRWLSLGT